METLEKYESFTLKKSLFDEKTIAELKTSGVSLITVSKTGFSVADKENKFFKYGEEHKLWLQ